MDTRTTGEKSQDLMHPNEVCRFFGDINRVTLWRHVRDGRIPAPVKISARMNRWLRSECEAARQKMIEARRGPEAA